MSMIDIGWENLARVLEKRVHPRERPKAGTNREKSQHSGPCVACDRPPQIFNKALTLQPESNFEKTKLQRKREADSHKKSDSEQSAPPHDSAQFLAQNPE